MDDPEGCGRARRESGRSSASRVRGGDRDQADGSAVPAEEDPAGGGKYVEAFALEGDLDPAAVTSNEFELEWPPRSGRLERFPEAVEARWMSLAEARAMMLPSQLPLLDALEEKLG